MNGTHRIEAADLAAGLDLADRWCLKTSIDRLGAARTEGTALRQVDQRRRHAWDLREAAAARIVARHGIDKSLGIGMARRAHHIRRATRLDNAARVHDRNAIGERGHDGEIVRDPDHGRARARTERLRLGENLRLDGHVECRRRLVGNDEVGLVDEGDCDRYALAHAARKLVRVILEAALRRGNADFGERGANPAARHSFIITEELAPTISLEDFTRDWRAVPPPAALKHALIRRVAEMTGRMHRAGVNHRDCYICHFLLHTDTPPTADNLRLSLIDLHRAQVRPSVPRRWRDKDLAGLYFSALDIGLTRRDRLRFLKHYFQRPLRRILAEEAALLTMLERKAARLQERFERKYAKDATGA